MVDDEHDERFPSSRQGESIRPEQKGHLTWSNLWLLLDPDRDRGAQSEAVRELPSHKGEAPWPFCRWQRFRDWDDTARERGRERKRERLLTSQARVLAMKEGLVSCKLGQRALARQKVLQSVGERAVQRL